MRQPIEMFLRPMAATSWYGRQLYNLKCWHLTMRLFEDRQGNYYAVRDTFAAGSRRVGAQQIWHLRIRDNGRTQTFPIELPDDADDWRERTVFSRSLARHDGIVGTWRERVLAWHDHMLPSASYMKPAEFTRASTLYRYLLPDDVPHLIDPGTPNYFKERGNWGAKKREEMRLAALGDNPLAGFGI